MREKLIDGVKIYFQEIAPPKTTIVKTQEGSTKGNNAEMSASAAKS
jgi:hypothetical protein